MADQADQHADYEREGRWRGYQKMPARDAELVRPPCGICQQPADLYGTVPMCGERPRYPMCFGCHEDLDWSGYVEDVRLIDGQADA